ncbi:unnamed protein product [Angiostrongylus costaricensis]|uniref:BTB domain-containing protein n=1 Tax=Angiostrongylus costaricensis TaxID=334426 RepID=A0A158PJ69_ANGCS|nr:unnamed protein product [Angiostrongylus costaricensis]
MSTGSSIITTEECETAEEIDDPSFGFIQFQLSVDDVGLQGVRIRPGSSEFEYEHFLFTVNQENQCTIKFSCSTVPEYEWRIIVQMRIKVGIAGATILKVVDKDVFEFYPKARPISFEVTNDAVGSVKFELRILNKLIEPLPTFEEGDLTIHFAQDTPIRVYRELIALFSPYMRKCTESAQRTCVEDFPKDAFIEMLYHIYPTLRPLYRNMRNLAKAAVAFQAIPLIYELSKNLWDFNTRSVRIVFVSAMEYASNKRTQDGVWGHLIKLGFEPETFFGAEIYRRLVCPAILANLLQEPPESCDVYRDQIIFAENFGLRNMLSICIQRAEASCNAFANELVRRKDFNLISSETRDLIMDRLCSGWGLEPKYMNKLGTRRADSCTTLAIIRQLNKIPSDCFDHSYRTRLNFDDSTRPYNLEPTSFRERQIGLTCGGPQCFDDERNMATLANMDSDYYFGSVGELCVVKD